ncbi:MAG: hypothetical protein ACRDZP_00755, partial [Acidimicrobiales bacterium]
QSMGNDAKTESSIGPTFAARADSASGHCFFMGWCLLAIGSLIYLNPGVNSHSRRSLLSGRFATDG